MQGRNIKNNRFEWNNQLYVSQDKFDKLKRSHCREGDLAFPKIGTIGVCAIMPKVEGHSVYLLSTNMMKMSVNTSLADLKYVYYFFSQEGIREQIRSQAGGSSQPIFNFTTLKNFEIELPSISDQKKVVAILSAYDDLIENNLKRIKILEELAQTIYREWFINFRFPEHEKVKMVKSELGMIPEGWEVRKLGDLTRLITRGISPQYDDNSKNIVINQRCIRDFRLNLENIRKNSKKVTAEKYVQRGDILINSTGIGTLGRLTQLLIDIPNCTVDSHVTIVRPLSEILFDYLGLQLFTRQSYFESQAKGATGQTELSRESISNADCLTPPHELQKIFSDIVSPMRNLSIQLSIKNDNLRKTRDLLLPKLISGEIDVGTLYNSEAMDN